MKNSTRSISCLATLIIGLGSITAHAMTWDFDGVVGQCNPTACDLAGITVGEPIAGFIKANEAVSGPNSTFGAADIVDYGIAAQGVTVGPADSTLVSATVTTDADGELSSGILIFAGEIDGGIFGTIELDITIDVGMSTWMIETDFLGLGVVASGPGQWMLEFDGDGLAAIQDNCVFTANPAQRDTDADGIGNFCDPDFNQDCFVNFLDLLVMRVNFFQSGDLVTDLDGNGFTNFGDLLIVRRHFFAEPGPSGVLNGCAL